VGGRADGCRGAADAEAAGLAGASVDVDAAPSRPGTAVAAFGVHDSSPCRQVVLTCQSVCAARIMQSQLSKRPGLAATIHVSLSMHIAGRLSVNCGRTELKIHPTLTTPSWHMH